MDDNTLSFDDGRELRRLGERTRRSAAAPRKWEPMQPDAVRAPALSDGGDFLVLGCRERRLGNTLGEGPKLRGQDEWKGAGPAWMPKARAFVPGAGDQVEIWDAESFKAPEKPLGRRVRPARRF